MTFAGRSPSVRISGLGIFVQTQRDLVLAPSDFWNIEFQARLENLVKDKDKFPDKSYACKETINEIYMVRSCQRGVTKRCQKTEIDWDTVDSHLEGLDDLFRKGRKITIGMELIYKEVPCDLGTTKRKKKKSTTNAQKLQQAAEAGLWTRVYKHYRCQGKYCKQGPYCWPDERGDHHRVLPRHLDAILQHIKDNMQEGEKKEEVNVGIEVPPNIIQDVLDDSRERKTDSAVSCRHCKTHISAHCQHCNVAQANLVEGDRKDRLEEYCNWTLNQVENDKWRDELCTAIRFALD